MVSLLYDQRTGEFSAWEDPDDGGVERCIYSTKGYAGRGPCRNNPKCQDRKNEGPIPLGHYRVRKVFRYKLADPVFSLTPASGQEMFGRSGFLIHGDNPTHNASRGCIILWKSARDTVLELMGDRDHVDLEVCASAQREDLTLRK